ncbi:MAG: phosphatase PAP2 family protein [Candidatus Aminicenantes bacterium]|jgi:membrane-associated phospholipid phosphatase
MTERGRTFLFRYSDIRFRVLDIACVGFLGSMGILLIFFHKTVDAWPRFVWIHAVLVFVVLELVRAGEKHPQNKILWFVRTFYPIAIFLFGWSEVNTVVRMFFGTFWFTDPAIAMDRFLFGVHPSVWFQQFTSPLLDEIMGFFYASYYLFLPSVVLVLYIKGKREETLAVFSFLSVTLLSNYFLFYILPALSPSMAGGLAHLHTKTYNGYFFMKLILAIQSNAGIAGGAFPSSHISEAFVLVLAALRYEKKLGLVLFPVTFGVAVSTVYLGYHHAVDPIFGFIWGGICYIVTLKLLELRKEDPLSA